MDEAVKDDFALCVCVCVHMHVCACVCTHARMLRNAQFTSSCQLAILGSWCSPTMLVLEIEPRSSGLAASVFTYGAISLTQE